MRKTIGTLIVICLIAITAHGAFAQAKDKPLWAQARTLAAAAPLCVDAKGVYRIRPNRDGGYWLTCSNGDMIRVRITVQPNAFAVARL